MVKFVQMKLHLNHIGICLRQLASVNPVIEIPNAFQNRESFLFKMVQIWLALGNRSLAQNLNDLGVYGKYTGWKPNPARINEATSKI